MELNLENERRNLDEFRSIFDYDKPIPGQEEGFEAQKKLVAALERIGHLEARLTEKDERINRLKELRDTNADLEARLAKYECEHGNGLTDYCEPCGRVHNA